MPSRTKQYAVYPSDGHQGADLTEWTGIPDAADTTVTRGVAKAPTSGAWVALTAMPNFDRLGYVTAKVPDGTRAKKVRFVLTDHPDGAD